MLANVPLPSPTASPLPTPADLPSIGSPLGSVFQTMQDSILGLVGRAWPELVPLFLLMVAGEVLAWWLDPQRKAPKQLTLF